MQQEKMLKKKLASGWEPEYFNAADPVPESEMIDTEYGEKLNPNNRIVITGAGGLVKFLKNKGFANILAVDIKPLYE